MFLNRPEGVRVADGLGHASFRAAAGGGDWAIVASTIAGSSNGSSVTTSAIDTTGANLVVVVVGWNDITATQTLSDSKTNTWSPLTQRGGEGDLRSQIYYVGDGSAVVGTSHTFTLTGGANNFPAIAVIAFSGAAAASVADQENGSGVGFGASLQPGSITPSVDNSMIIASIFRTVGAAASINSSFVIRQELAAGGNNWALAIATLQQGSAAAVNPTWSWTGDESCLASIADFERA